MSDSRKSYSTLRASRSPDSQATRSDRDRRYRSRSPIDRYRRNYKSSSRDDYSRNRSRSDRSYGDTRSRDRYGFFGIIIYSLLKNTKNFQIFFSTVKKETVVAQIKVVDPKKL